MCALRLAMLLIWLYMVMCQCAGRRALEKTCFFSYGGANAAQRIHLCVVTDRITDRKVIGFGFGYVSVICFKLPKTKDILRSVIGYPTEPKIGFGANTDHDHDRTYVFSTLS